MEKIGTRFRRSVRSFADASGIPVVKFATCDRKLEVMRRNLEAQASTGVSGVAAIGFAQEFQNLYASCERPGQGRVKLQQLHSSVGASSLHVMSEGVVTPTRPTCPVSAAGRPRVVLLLCGVDAGPKGKVLRLRHGLPSGGSLKAHHIRR